jgi:8-oxo-dGTP diphosphatase
LLINGGGAKVCRRSDHLSEKECDLGAQQQGADMTKNRWLTIPRTLCFVLNGDDVLLMKRSPNRRVFPNQYNGVGGHIERGEDPLAGAIREIKEETSLDVNNVSLRAIYNIDAGEATGIVLFVFLAWSDSRDALADEREGTLHWIPRDNVLEYDLVEDIPEILPRILVMNDTDEPLFVHVSYDESDAIIMRFNENG